MDRQERPIDVTPPGQALRDRPRYTSLSGDLDFLAIPVPEQASERMQELLDLRTTPNRSRVSPPPSQEWLHKRG